LEIRKLEKWENVFKGRATASCPKDKWVLRLDSARRIDSGSTPHKSSDCSVDVPTGGEVCSAKIRKSEMWENVFNGGATTSGCMDKWRPQLDSARQIGIGSTPHKSSDCGVDVLTGGEVCWAKIRKSEMWENVFNGRATTSGCMYERMLRLDSARQTCLGNTSHEPSDCRCGGEVC